MRDRIFGEGDEPDRVLLRDGGRRLSSRPTIHTAAQIVVPESLARPYAYYIDNVTKSLELSDELVALAPQSPYARTELMMEMALRDMAVAADLQAVILRYFNPIGSDPDLESAVYVREPSHVLGQIVLTAQGLKDTFTITGTDQPTRDGTGIRDYIHVWDLAKAHVAAVERFDDVLAQVDAPSTVINVGTGEGVTVRELISAFERVYGAGVPVTEAPPRPGDAVGAYAKVDLSRKLLDWRAGSTLDEAIDSALRWGRKRKEVLGYE